MEKLTVRPAAITDLETLLEFEQAMIVAERPFDETIRTGEGVCYYDLERLIAAPNVEIVVALHASQIIALRSYRRIKAVSATQTTRITWALRTSSRSIAEKA